MDPTLTHLSYDDCWLLLATQEVGRLGVLADHYPVVLPVNFALDGKVLVVRLGDGRTHAAAVSANVTFEVDQIDAATRSGWSVLVRGLAEEVTDAHREDLVARTRASGASPWAPGERGRWMRIIPHSVTGRRIVPGDLPPPFLDAGYL